MNPEASAKPRVSNLRAGFYSLLERGAGMVLSVGTAVILLRHLSKADFAAWALFILITYFIEMGRSGLIQNGLMRHLALHRHNQTEAGDIASAALTLNLAFALLSNLALWAFSGWIMRNWGAPQLENVWVVYFFSNIAASFLYHFNFVQQSHLEFRGIFWATFCQRGLLLAWVLFCTFSGRELRLFEMSVALLAGIAGAAALSFLFASPFLSPWRGISYTWILKLIAYGKYVLGTNLSAMMYKNADKLVLGKLLGPAAFAVYDAAGKVTQLVEAPAFSIAAVVFPQSAEHTKAGGRAAAAGLYERSVGATLAIILPFVVFVLVFAEPVMLLFAGPAYADAVGILRLTAFFGLFMPYAVQFGTLLDATGRPALNFLYTIFTAVLNIILSYWFIRNVGLMGAALATLTGYAISFLLMQRLLYREYGVLFWRAWKYIPEFYMLIYKRLRKA